MPLDTPEILKKATQGYRISTQEALILFQEDNLHLLAQAADAIRLRFHPNKIVTYIVDRNINYTNVCVSLCKFCAFSRPQGHPQAYTLTLKQLGQKIQQTLQLGGIQILLQGGLHPGYKLDWYEKMLRFIKDNFVIHVHGFSPPEILHFARLNRLTLRDVLLRLRDAGLDTIPGGGAEILVDRVRKEISPSKCSSEEWLAVMETAHTLGIRTTATMMFGHLETHAERVQHLERIRALQDRTRGFTAFIPWTFQPQNTCLSWVGGSGSTDYLRTLAISRIYLDNIPNIQASWVTQGDKIAQIALRFGANDIGSTMLEENVVSACGTNFRLTEDQIRGIIEGLGYIPKRRNCYYDIAA